MVIGPLLKVAVTALIHETEAFGLCVSIDTTTNGNP